MMASNADTVPPLPNATPRVVTSEITVHPPLSRRGTGPGLILIAPAALDLSAHEKSLDPPPLQKWAEESYAVAQITVGEDASGLAEHLGTALAELEKLPECETTEKVGLVVIASSLDAALLSAIQSRQEIAAAVFYGCAPESTLSFPALAHLPGSATASSSPVKSHVYPGADAFFVIPAHADFRGGPSAVAHTRSLVFLKPLLGGPFFDLEAIWDEHTRFEFENRSVEHTMSTMVQQPYVNNVPTLTGGVGREFLTGFYRDHFIFSNPADSAMELVSRTVGVDRIIDEFIFTGTHDKVIGWMLPGIPPTGRKLSIPVTSVVNVRGDRLYHEHIAWDQGTVLRQLGLLPDYLPYPYPVEGAEGKKFEYRVPVMGAETAQKLIDETSVESNEMLGFKMREVTE